MDLAARYGDWALIAGGSEGVGESLARQLAAAGMNLVLLARKPGPLEALAADIRQATGREVRTASVDLSRPDALAQARKLTDDVAIGVLVFMAGAGHRVEDFHAVPLDEWMTTVGCNVHGQTAFAHHYGEAMKRRGKGAIMLVGSMAGLAGSAKLAVYSAAKAYSATLAEALWYELKPHGVDVLALTLSATKTPAMARMGLDMDHPDFPAADPDDVAAEALAHLADGPVWYASGNAGRAAYVRGLPRRDAVTEMSQGTASISHKD
ncbi:MAG: SDR family NAD(P)-dependent oxidoreductase [Novosphingobium sp.]|nr:SDR family NAD(P)-dependent oxidoreductase [Novosphingobium sp.]